MLVTGMNHCQILNLKPKKMVSRRSGLLSLGCNTAQKNPFPAFEFAQLKMTSHVGERASSCLVYVDESLTKIQILKHTKNQKHSNGSACSKRFAQEEIQCAIESH